MFYLTYVLKLRTSIYIYIYILLTDTHTHTQNIRANAILIQQNCPRCTNPAPGVYNSNWAIEGNEAPTLSINLRQTIQLERERERERETLDQFHNPHRYNDVITFPGNRKTVTINCSEKKLWCRARHWNGSGQNMTGLWNVGQCDRTAIQCVQGEHKGEGHHFTLQMEAAGLSATFTTSYKTTPRHTSETAGFLLHIWPKHVAEFISIDDMWYYTTDAIFFMYVSDCSHNARNE